MRRSVFCLPLVVIFALGNSAPARSQINIGGIINEVARQAQDAERRRLQGEEQGRRDRAVILEHQRRDAEIRAQQKLDRDRQEAQLREEADRKLAAQAEKDRQAKQAQEAKDRKEAFDRLVPVAKQLIEDTSEFLKSYPRDAIALVERLANLDSALSAGDPVTLESLIRRLKGQLEQQPGFQAFAQKRDDERKDAASQRLTTLSQVAKHQRNFIRYHVTENPTSRATRSLLPLVRELDATLSAPDLQKVQEITSRTESTVRAVGLWDEFTKSKSVLEEPQTPSSPIRRTAKNAFLLDGHSRDFVSLFNSTPKAPHVARKLSGDVEFEQGQAKACLYQAGFEKSEPHLLKQLLANYQLKALEIDATECNRSDLFSYDVVAIRREALEQLKSTARLFLLAEIEAGRFQPLKTATHEDQEQAKERENAERRENEAAIQGGGAGYGVVISDKDNSTMCLVAAEKVRAHKKWLNNNADRLSSEVKFTSVSDKRAMEDVYRAHQRQECGSVYAAAGDLKKVADALKRDGGAYVVSVLWSKDADIDTIEKQLDQEAREEAAKRQQQADAQKGISASKENRQRELQAQFGKIAASTAAAISNEVRSAFDADDWQNTRGFQQFPRAVTYYQRLVQSRWELQSFNSSVSDYGVANWGGRALEASFTTVSVRMRNRILGEYKDICLVFGRINDVEFSIPRDPIARGCNEASQIDGWKRAHKFQSRWWAE